MKREKEKGKQRSRCRHASMSIEKSDKQVGRLEVRWVKAGKYIPVAPDSPTARPVVPD